ncbi:hypothetical protein PIB30_058295 [Stylosanthes scabra]|uniref:Uncharacterized protein n=1 Tax=Stylosanthes scabra TaxID=79078 RepID=A0ABU6YHC1_9FABA|nr:hypothetical protein [Stylosanthes scabra]
MSSNFKTKFKSKNTKRQLINAAYAPTENKYKAYMTALATVRLDMRDWADRFQNSLWLQHCDEGRRWGHMTMNLSHDTSQYWQSSVPRISVYNNFGLGRAKRLTLRLLGRLVSNGVPYVDPVFRLESVQKVYNTNFPLILDERMCPD